jgi:hypothetical protein
MVGPRVGLSVRLQRECADVAAKSYEVLRLTSKSRDLLLPRSRRRQHKLALLNVARVWWTSSDILVHGQARVEVEECRFLRFP